MRILHLTAPGATGGLERVVLGLTTALHGRGHDVAVLASIGGHEGPHPFVEALSAAGIEVHTLQAPGRAYRAELAGMTDLIDAYAPDVVHSHGFRSDVLGLVAARRSDRPIVSTVHGLTGGNWKVRLYERIQQIALRRFDGVVAVSDVLARAFERSGFRKDRIHTIRNALVEPREPLPRREARAALGLPADARIVGWVGRFGAEKGPDLFIEALAALGPDVLGVMIGDGPERAPTAALAKSRGADDRLRLTGAIDGADRYLLAFDALTLSSRTEGTPMILLEAMAAGVPVVTTAVGGVPDVVGPGEAMLVAPGDAGALADAIRAVLDAPAEAEARARRAHQRLEQEFAVEPWVLAYEVTYRTAVERRRGK